MGQLQLQADDEQEQDNPEFRHRGGGPGIPDQLEPGRADRPARGEVAEHCAETDEPEHRNRDHGCTAEGQNRRKETGVGSGACHVLVASG